MVLILKSIFLKKNDEFEQEIEIRNGKVIKDVKITHDGDVLNNIHPTLGGNKGWDN